MFDIEEIKKIEMTSITNFISQEAYRLAVIKQYPDDVSRIYNLSRLVRHEILKLFEKHANIDPIIEGIILNLVSNIVAKSPFDKFNEEINNLISKWWECESDYESNNDIKNAENTIEDDVDLRKKMQNVVVDLFIKNQDFQCEITHKFPAALFAIELDKNFLLNHYHDVLAYFYGMAFLPITRKNVTRYCGSPYRVFSQIAPTTERSWYNMEHGFNRVEIPTSALSRSEGEIDINCDMPNLRESYLTLHEFRGRKNTDITTELIVRIDLSKALSNNELDRLLSHLRSDISEAQESNKISYMCLAETDDELVTGYNLPRLHTDHHFNASEQYRANSPLLINTTDAKNALCALILISMHFIKHAQKNGEVTVSWQKDNKHSNLQKSMDLLAIELRDKHSPKSFSSHKSDNDDRADYAGFSAAMIERGYKELNKLIKNHLDDFQRERVQFDKKLNQTQRNKLHAEMEVSLEHLHPDDRTRAEYELKKHLKSGRKASIKPLKNGAYVIIPD